MRISANLFVCLGTALVFSSTGNAAEPAKKLAPPRPTEQQIKAFKSEWTDPATGKRIVFETSCRLVAAGKGPDPVKWPAFHKRWKASEASGHRSYRLLAHLAVTGANSSKETKAKEKVRDNGLVHYYVFDEAGKTLAAGSLRTADMCLH